MGDQLLGCWLQFWTVCGLDGLDTLAVGAFKACINLAGGSSSDSVAESSFMSACPFPFGMGVGLVSFTSLFPITFLNGVSSLSDLVTLQVLSQCHMFPLCTFAPHLINCPLHRTRKRSRLTVCYSKIGTFGGWLICMRCCPSHYHHPPLQRHHEIG